MQLAKYLMQGTDVEQDMLVHTCLFKQRKSRSVLAPAEQGIRAQKFQRFGLRSEKFEKRLPVSHGETFIHCRFLLF